MLLTEPQWSRALQLYWWDEILGVYIKGQLSYSDHYYWI